MEIETNEEERPEHAVASELRDRLGRDTHYPVGKPFESIAEVEKYLSGEKIVCLLCGKEFKNLTSHINQTHKISILDYMDNYGIPYRFVLCSSSAIDNYSNASKKRHAKNNYQKCYHCGKTIKDKVTANVGFRINIDGEKYAKTKMQQFDYCSEECSKNAPFAKMRDDA